MRNFRGKRESLQTTMAYVFSDGWEDKVYRIDTDGRCNCDGYRDRKRGCKHTNAMAEAIAGVLERGDWRCDVDMIMTPWAAEELGLTETKGLEVRPTP